VIRLWQRNLLGTAVAAAALAVATVTTLWPSWSDYRAMTVPEHVVPAGESGTAAGQLWRVDRTRFYSSSPNRLNPDLPPGTMVHVVVTDSEGPALVGCSAVITDGHRRWSAESVAGYGPLPPGGTNAICGRPGLTQFSFLLPAGVSPTAMDLTDWMGRILVRLML
jgi:hypothetical protein